MDKSWIKLPHNSPAYLVGLNNFLDFAYSHASCNGKIVCPCRRCKFKKWHTREVVKEHLLVKPFPEEYTFWRVHGEKADMRYDTALPQSSQVGVHVNEHDPVNDAVRDAFGVQDDNFNEEVQGSEPVFFSNEAARDFFTLMDDADRPLYPGCRKYSKLSFLIKMYHIKCLCGITDKAMSMLLELLQDVFPDVEIPTSFYEAKKKIINRLGLNYYKNEQ